MPARAAPGRAAARGTHTPGHTTHNPPPSRSTANPACGAEIDGYQEGGSP